MGKIQFDNFELSVDDEGKFHVENKGNETCNLIFYNRKMNFWGSSLYDFKPGHWFETTPTKWNLGRVEEDGKVEISFEFNDKILRLEYCFKNKELTDITDKFETVVNGTVLKKRISILIPAYGVTDYIDETINNFIEIEKRYEYLDIEYIIGVDGCKDTFKHLSKKVYPENFSIVLTERNYGEPIMKNSLIHLCSNDKFIVFDSDDIPKHDMVNVIFEKLEEYDFVLFKSYNFNDGEDYEDKNVSPNFWGGCFGGVKSKFISINGWYPWRVNSDDEFKHRVQANKELKTLMLDEPMFYYRIRQNSSSRDEQTKDDSFLRRCYKDLMTEKITKRKFDNPNSYYYNKQIIYIQ